MAAESVGFDDFLRRSLAAVRKHVPARYRDMMDALGNRSVVIAVDDVRSLLVMRDGELCVEEAERDVAAELQTSGEEILALLDGKIELYGVLRDNRLRLRGETEDLVAFHAALMAYLHGCVRAPRMDVQLARYRESVERRRDGKTDG